MRKADFISRIFAQVGAVLSYIASCKSDFDFDVKRTEQNVQNSIFYVVELQYQLESCFK